MKCSTCNDEPLTYYGHEVFCADCNDDGIPKLNKDEILLTDQEEAYLRIVYQRTKSLDIRDTINKNSSLKAKKIVEIYRDLK